MGIERIFLIGAGKVATHLGFIIQEAGFEIAGVYNRTVSRGIHLAGLLKTKFTNKISEIDCGADLYLVCISDDAIQKITSEIYLKQGILAHTSGSQSIEILNNSCTYTGVIYPIQTFGSEQMVDFRQIPICIESNHNDSLELLKTFTSKLSENIQVIDSKTRIKIHLAAVFANNFSNFMYVIAEDLLRKNHLNMNLLIPLIRQTGFNLPEKDFFLRQTGPAVRGDDATILKHLELLLGEPEYREIYQSITDLLKKYQNRNGELQGTVD